MNPINWITGFFKDFKLSPEVLISIAGDILAIRHGEKHVDDVTDRLVNQGLINANDKEHFKNVLSKALKKQGLDDEVLANMALNLLHPVDRQRMIKIYRALESLYGCNAKDNVLLGVATQGDINQRQLMLEGFIEMGYHDPDVEDSPKLPDFHADFAAKAIYYQGFTTDKSSFLSSAENTFGFALDAATTSVEGATNFIKTLRQEVNVIIPPPARSNKNWFKRMWDIIWN